MASLAQKPLAGALWILDVQTKNVNVSFSIRQLSLANLHLSKPLDQRCHCCLWARNLSWNVLILQISAHRRHSNR